MTRLTLKQPTTKSTDSCSPSTERAQVWIVVPAYNEERRLPDTLNDLARYYDNLVVVDDGSCDATADLAESQSQAWILRHPINSGQGAALQTGIDFALQRGADIVVTFDGDGQHSVEDIADLIEPIVEGRVDVVLGSRFLGTTEGMPWSRWFVLRLAIAFTRVFSNINVTDTHNGLRAFSRLAASKIRIKLNRMAHASEILDQIRSHKLPFCECPVTVRYTEQTLEKGQSSWNSLRIVAQLLMAKIIRP